MYLTLCLCLSSRVLATACNLCNHWKYKTYKKYKTKLQKMPHWGGQNHQQKGNTTYIGGFAVLFFDGMSKERKIQKDKVQSVKEWKNTKKYKNTKCIFGSNGKYNKSTKIQSVFFVIWQKMQNKYECNLKHTTKYEPKVSNIQNTKKSTN